MGSGEELREHAHAAVPHDLHLRVGARDALSDHRVAVQTALAGQQDEPVDLGLEPDRRGGRGLTALEAEQGHRDRPAVVDPTDHLVDRADGVGVEDLVELALAGDHADRADLDARLTHVDEQEGDALVLRRVRIGPGQREDVIGEMTGGGPDLLAVEDPLVAVTDRLEPDVAEVRPRVGLAVALTPGVLTGQDPRQVALLLLVAPHEEQRVAEHLDTEDVVRAAGRHPRSGELLGEDDLLEGRESGTAELDRPAGCQIAGFEERLPPLGHELLDGAPLEGSDTRPVRREFLGEEGLDLLAVGLGGGFVGGAHRPSVVRPQVAVTAGAGSIPPVATRCRATAAPPTRTC